MAPPSTPARLSCPRSGAGKPLLDIGPGAKLISDQAIYVGEETDPVLNKPTAGYNSLLTIESGGKGSTSTFLTIGNHQNGSLMIKSGGTMTDVNGYVGAEIDAMGTATIQGHGPTRTFSSSG